MAENNESFREELKKLASIVELLESGFIGKDFVDVEIKIPENKLNFLNHNLNTQQRDKVIINIENTNFIFSKK
jgi:hypothetical protein